MNPPTPVYAGFWRRLCATLIDAVLIIVITFTVHLTLGFALGAGAGPLLDFLLGWVLPAVATVWFWRRFQGTPGKRLLRVLIVDATTGKPLGTRQCVVRYLGYFVSLLPLGLGYLWIAFDARKQGWHDKLGRSVVVFEDD